MRCYKTQKKNSLEDNRVWHYIRIFFLLLLHAAVIKSFSLRTLTVTLIIYFTFSLSHFFFSSPVTFFCCFAILCMLLFCSLSLRVCFCFRERYGKQQKESWRERKSEINNSHQMLLLLSLLCLALIFYSPTLSHSISLNGTK